MYQQEEMFFEDDLDAARQAVKAVGGNKAFGKTLWPEMDADAAGRKLADCLNTHRDARLTFSQMLLLMRMAREKGFHGLAEFAMSETGYARPVPVNPQDEAALRVQQLDEVLRRAATLASSLEKLRNSPVMRNT